MTAAKESRLQSGNDWRRRMSAPPGNANARRQPGERVNRITDNRRLLTRANTVKTIDRFRDRKIKHSPIGIGGAVRE